VLGVVYVPAQDKLYYGVVGQGAWTFSDCSKVNDVASNKKTDNYELAAGNYSQSKEIRVRAADHQKGLTVVMSRSHPSPELEAYLKDIKVAEALPIGSSLKLCVVAEGSADLYPRLGPTMEWDTAAGHAIVLASGGGVTVVDGTPFLYNKNNLLNTYFIAKG
jgi:3'(2'), 5'-bisphosphate nucleotidase